MKLASLSIGLFLACSDISSGADSGDALTEPQSLLKAIASIESSSFDELTSSKDEQGTSYHLGKAVLLGTIIRDNQTYTIVHAAFVRSSPPGRETPPARGHNFIVVLNGRFQVAAHGRTASGDYHMQGTKLFSDNSPVSVADFASTDAGIRHGGYVEIGLPYPFQDRISEEDWESGAFLKTLSAKDHESGLYPDTMDSTSNEGEQGAAANP